MVEAEAPQLVTHDLYSKICHPIFPFGDLAYFGALLALRNWVGLLVWLLVVLQDIGVTLIRISQVVHGKRAISVDTAMRLARYFGTSTGVWLRMQVRYDLEVAQDRLSDRINREVKVLRQQPDRVSPST